MGQYFIDREAAYMDDEEKARATEWLKLVNEELGNIGCKLEFRMR